MKYEIMIRILFNLLNNKKVTATWLANEYGVSTRTIYRYIDCLSYANIPITCDKGRDGGFFILDNFKLTSSFMTKEEFNAVISALDGINAQLKNSKLKSATEKLKSINRIEKNSLTLSSGNLIIDAGPWGDAIGYRAKLGVLEEGIEKNTLLEIVYHDREGEITTRLIEPHTIVFKQGLWYVYAWCRLRNDFRFFKTGRIESLRVLDEKFIRRNIPNESELFDTWYDKADKVAVTFIVDKTVLSDVEEWLGVENITEIDGKFIAKAKLPNDNGLIPKIMSYGNGLSVVSPDNLKKKLVESAKRLIENYS